MSPGRGAVSIVLSGVPSRLACCSSPTDSSSRESPWLLRDRLASISVRLALLLVAIASAMTTKIEVPTTATANEIELIPGAPVPPNKT